MAAAADSSRARSKPLNLLGLGDTYTLVLVDGRRFNAVTPTNIANIPTGAIVRLKYSPMAARRSMDPTLSPAS